MRRRPFPTPMPIPLPVFVGEEAPLEPVSLVDDTYTSPAKVILRQGNTMRVHLIPDLDDRITGLRRASQLALLGASVVLQYFENTDNNVDIGNSDLASGFGASQVWEGEVDAVSDIPASTGAVWWVRDIEDIRWRSAGGALLSVSNIQSAFQTNARWLTQNSVADITTHFVNNNYLSNRFYYYYDNALTEIRRFTRTSGWTTLTAGNEFDEVANSEVTLNAANLQTQLYFDVTLADDAITADKIDEFRFDIILND